MKWANYHSHSDYSDGFNSIREMVETAIEMKMHSIGISDHAPLPLEVNWKMDKQKLGSYFKTIALLKEAYKEDIQVYAGLEVDYIPGKISPTVQWVKDLPLDYTIGSVHFVDSFKDGTPWAVDSTLNSFRRGLSLIFNNDIKLAVSRYYELIREMVLFNCPTIVGHLDRIQRNNFHNFFFNEEEQWYVREVEKTLNVIAEAGAILELNTQMHYNTESRRFNPEAWMLDLAHQLKIPVTLSSDAHNKENLTESFVPALKALAGAGYEELMILQNGQWNSVPYSFSTGILVSETYQNIA